MGEPRDGTGPLWGDRDGLPTYPPAGALVDRWDRGRVMRSG
ncbi:hypothetical protein [Streptomyces sp. NPDC050287]